MVSRVKRNQSHARNDGVAYSFDDSIGNGIVTHMPPPDKHVGVFQHLFGQPTFVVRKHSRSYLEILF